MAGTVNETIGEIRADIGALQDANLALSLGEAVAACEAEGFSEAYQKRVDEAGAKLDAARDRAYRARSAVGERLRDFNAALRNADAVNDVVDLVGATAALTGLIFSGGLLAVGAAGVGLAADGFTALGRPDEPGLLAAGSSAGQFSSGVIGVGDAVSSLPVRGGPFGLPTPGPGLIRPGLGALDAGVGAANNVLSALNSDARSLLLGNQATDGLRDLQRQLARTDLTFVEGWTGADKEALDKAIDEALAAEAEYEKAFKEWQEALRADAASKEGTCIQNKQRELEERGPDGRTAIANENELANQEYWDAVRNGDSTRAAMAKLRSIRERLQRRLDLRAPRGG